MKAKILVGADAYGMKLKNAVKHHLEKNGYEVVDIGMHNVDEDIPFYEISACAAGYIQRKEIERAVLFCGTGMGVAIVANKFKGVYAGVVESKFTAEMCKVINNCNVLTMGAMIVSEYMAEKAVDSWLAASHTVGLEDIAGFLKESQVKIAAMEARNMK